MCTLLVLSISLWLLSTGITCRLVPAANSASYISFMADAHWAASARMPSDLLLSEAVQVAQQACKLEQQPQAAHWVVVLEHLRQCCQAYRYDFDMVSFVPSSHNSLLFRDQIGQTDFQKGITVYDSPAFARLFGFLCLVLRLLGDCLTPYHKGIRRAV